VHHLREGAAVERRAARRQRILVVGEQGLGDEFDFANIRSKLSGDGKLEQRTLSSVRLIPTSRRSGASEYESCDVTKALLANDKDAFAVRAARRSTAAPSRDEHISAETLIVRISYR